MYTMGLLNIVAKDRKKEQKKNYLFLFINVIHNLPYDNCNIIELIKTVQLLKIAYKRTFHLITSIQKCFGLKHSTFVVV